MLKLLALVLTTWAGFANAEVAFPFDPDRLFADHAAKVEHLQGGAEKLVLQGVEVVRNGDEVVAADMSGAVGCYLSMLIEFREIFRLCAPLTAEEEAGLDSRIRRVKDFAAKNAYPPISVEDLDALLAEQVDQSDYDKSLCQRAKEEGDWIPPAKGYLAGPQSDALTDAYLETPRLPVMNPCL